MNEPNNPNSIMDWFKRHGLDGSYKAREKLFRECGFSNYCDFALIMKAVPSFSHTHIVNEEDCDASLAKADELSLPAILTIDGTDRRIAETIAGNTRQKSLNILTLDSMQSVTAKEIEDGTTYLSIMENNLYVLKEALQ